MAGKCMFLFYTLLTTLNTRTVNSLEETGIAEYAETVLAKNKPLKRTEAKCSSIPIKTLPETPTVIHHGNNLFINSNFNFGPPLTSFKEEHKVADNTSVTSKVLMEDSSVIIRESQIRQVPFGIFPSISALKKELDIRLPPKRLLSPSEYGIQNDLPFTWIPVPCTKVLNIAVSCMPHFVPILTELQQTPRDQAPVEISVRPIVIPKPPELPPIILPKLPIQVTIRKPMFTKLPGVMPIPDQPIFVHSLCPPMVKCVAPEKDLPSGLDILNTIFDKLKNLLSMPTRIDLSNFLVTDEVILTPNLPFIFPTRCVQGIIAERVVPNIVENDEDIKVLMSPVLQSRSSFV